MNELKHTIDGIFRRIQKLLEQKKAYEDVIAKLQSEASTLRSNVRDKDKRIDSLIEEIETIKMTKQFAGGGENNGEFSDKINEMIKELDVVIGKLKSEKE